VIIAALIEKPTIMELPALPDDTSTIPERADAQVKGAESARPETQKPESQAGGKMGSGSMFDRIAFVYDSTNKWMSLGLDQFWRKTLIEECMQLERADMVLDLATGTADVSLLAGNRLRDLGRDAAANGAAVLGVDPSNEMLRRGVAKVESQGLKGVIKLVKGDAQDLAEVRGIDAEGKLDSPTSGVESHSVDKISMAFGIRNVPDRSLALREMRRVLRSKASSRVCILEFSLPDGSSFLSRLARKFITHVVPAIGRVATIGSGAEEYEYLERSILEFPQPSDFATVMAREGLRVRTITSFAYGAVHLYAAMPAHVTTSS
jgi:demethylmenaquinone methyltransferase/2-methoxy-6-polyprenyl-1,4-benzoquinol methylase